MKFYLAAPFFNEEQLGIVQTVETISATMGHECFSPRIKCMCPPTAPMEQRKISFMGNCMGIKGSDFVLARIDDFDPGTIWELGFAFGIGMFSTQRGLVLRQPKLYAFTTVPSRGLNLMLAQSVDGFLKGMDSVAKFLQEMQSGDDTEAKKWSENII